MFDTSTPLGLAYTHTKTLAEGYVFVSLNGETESQRWAKRGEWDGHEGERIGTPSETNFEGNGITLGQKHKKQNEKDAYKSGNRQATGSANKTNSNVRISRGVPAREKVRTSYKETATYASNTRGLARTATDSHFNRETKKKATKAEYKTTHLHINNNLKNKHKIAFGFRFRRFLWPVGIEEAQSKEGVKELSRGCTFIRLGLRADNSKGVPSKDDAHFMYNSYPHHWYRYDTTRYGKVPMNRPCLTPEWAPNYSRRILPFHFSTTMHIIVRY